MAYPNIINIIIQQLKVPQPTLFQGIGCIIDLGTTTIPVGTAHFVSPNEGDTIFAEGTDLTINEVYKKIVLTFKSSSGNGVYVFNAGSPSGTAPNLVYTSVISEIDKYLQESSNKPYVLSVPYEFWGLEDFISFTENYNNANGITYFLFDTQGTAFESGVWQKYDGNKSIIGVYKNDSSLVFCSCAFLGVMISNKTTPLSAVNRMTSFDYSRLAGVEPTNGNSAFIKGLIDNSIMFFGYTADEVTLRNAVLADKNTMNYWFNIDYVQVALTNSLEVIIYNGANAQPPLFFNQQGINRLKSNITGTINTGQAVGIVNEFKLDAIPFIDYKKLFPAEYAKGAYNGFALTIDGQKYILSVQLVISYS